MSVSGTRAFVASLLVAIVTNPVWADPGPKLPSVQPNDNRLSAGRLVQGILTLKLRAEVGLWRPEGESGPALKVEAFGEETGPLTAPAPLIRVPESTEIVASIRNDLDAPLRVHGLCARDDDATCAPIEVPPSLSRDVRFRAGRAGTYHYWATTTGVPLPFRAAPDTQLSGAFIVDPRDRAPDVDRVLVITDWTSVTREELRKIAAADDPGVAFLALNPKFVFLINGLSWPATERFTYRLGEQVRWRVVNLSSQSHPLHLHGFHFQVDSLGDGLRDVRSDDGSKPSVVTQLLRPGGTLAMTWVPERVGNWLFHCHISAHVSPTTRLSASTASHADNHGAHQTGAGMAGMVLGVTVTDPDGTESECYRGASGIPTRKLTLTMETGPGRHGAERGYGFVLADSAESPARGGVPVPGPTLVLHRGQPVEITLVNRLPEATAIHWHGMELESYYDGVHGWSGVGQRLTPLIEPGQRFVVRFTPPQAGTFMYHTHLHDSRQLTAGLYGAMVVLDSGETFDPIVDHVVVISRGGPGADAPTLVNGERTPQFVWRAGARHRVRLIHITPDDIFVVSLRTADGPVNWRPLLKDAAAVPPSLSVPKPASQTIAVGETFDFEFEAPPGRRNLWLEVRSPAGKWFLQAHVIVRELSPSTPRTN
jgi:FtsP/CotA-like multicopper oxidase with cupredoxin domain